MAASIRCIDRALCVDGSELELLEMIRGLRDKWKTEDIVINKLSGGMLNSTWCCRHVDDINREDALMVRIYGNAAVNGLVCRDTDFFGMQLSHKLGCFPSVYACFNNGVVYKYAKGRTVTYRDLLDPDVMQNLTHHLQRLHGTSCPQTGLTNWKGEVVTHHFKRKNSVCFIRDVVRMISECEDPNKCHDFEQYRKEISKEMLLQECDFLENILNELGLPLVLSHNDIHYGNLVLNEDDKAITILDYELTGVNYEHNDIAFLMMSWQIMGPLGYAGPDTPSLTDDIREAYIKSYLRAKCEADNDNPPAAIPGKQVKLVSIAVRILETVACLRFIAISMLLSNIGGDIDMVPIIDFSKDIYFDLKAQAKTLRDNYLQIKSELRLNLY